MGDGTIEVFNAWAARDGWSTRVDGSLCFQSEKLKLAHGVWTLAAAGKAMPARAALTPRAMKSFLSHVILWDVVRGAGATQYRVRVVGSEPQSVLGGRPGDIIDDMAPEPFRTRWTRLADLTVAAARPLRAHGLVEFRNRTYFDSESFLAPLADDDGAIDAFVMVHVTFPRRELVAAAAAVGHALQAR